MISVDFAQRFKLESVFARILLAFGAVILIFGTAIGFSIHRLTQFNHDVHSVTERNMSKLSLESSWMITVVNSARHMQTLLNVADQKRVEENLAGLKADKAQRREYRATMVEIADTPEEKQLIQTVVEVRNAFVPVEEEFLSLFAAGKLTEARSLALEKVEPLQVAYIEQLSKLGDYYKALTGKQVAQLTDDYQHAKLTLLLLTAGAGACALVLAYLLARGIGNPLRRAVAVLDEIGRGNLNNIIVVRNNDLIHAR